MWCDHLRHRQDLVAEADTGLHDRIGVPQGVVDFIRALDPAALTDDDFEGLLAASGLVSPGPVGLTLPDRMAGVNALLDAASPALREALLVAFLDRLLRPVRGAGVSPVAR